MWVPKMALLDVIGQKESVILYKLVWEIQVFSVVCRHLEKDIPFEFCFRPG